MLLGVWDWRQTSTGTGTVLLTVGTAGLVVTAATRNVGPHWETNLDLVWAAVLILIGAYIVLGVHANWPLPGRGANLERERQHDERAEETRKDAHDTAVALKKLVALIEEQAQLPESRRVVPRSPRPTKRGRSLPPPSQESEGKD